jgi:hypothetical protein
MSVDQALHDFNVLLGKLHGQDRKDLFQCVKDGINGIHFFQITNYINLHSI